MYVLSEECSGKHRIYERESAATYGNVFVVRMRNFTLGQPKCARE